MTTANTIEPRQVTALVSDDLPPGVTVAEAARWPTAREAAAQLGVSKATILRRYTGYLIGGLQKLRFDPRELAAGVRRVSTDRFSKPPAQRAVRTSAAAKARLERVFGKRKGGHPLLEPTPESV